MNNILDAEGITVSYGNKVLIDDASLSIMPGTINLLVGGNGTGKSSLMKALVMDRDFTGKCKIKSLKFLGKEIKNLRELGRKIVYVPQNYNANDFICETPYDEVMYAAKISGQFNSETDAKNFVDSLFLQFDQNEKIRNAKSISLLSGGKCGLLNIMTCLVKKEAKLFIFDEPINNLDSSTAVNFSNFLVNIVKEYQDIGIIVVTHCRMFPKADLAFTIQNKKIVNIDYSYQTCFGVADEEGIYR